MNFEGQDNLRSQELSPADMLVLADGLEATQAVLNNGRGLRFVQAICSCLRRGELEEARRVYFTDGDKLSQHLDTSAGQSLREILDTRLGNPIEDKTFLE